MWNLSNLIYCLPGVGVAVVVVGAEKYNVYKLDAYNFKLIQVLKIHK